MLAFQIFQIYPETYANNLCLDIMLLENCSIMDTAVVLCCLFCLFIHVFPSGSVRPAVRLCEWSLNNGDNFANDEWAAASGHETVITVAVGGKTLPSICFCGMS